MVRRIQDIAHRVLRWSERYFKTDMVYLASGGFWLTLGRFAASASSLILAIAFANLISPETYGAYKYVLSIFSILTLATLPGIDLSFQRAVARGAEGGMRSTLFTRIRWGLLGGAVGFAIAAYYFFKGNTELGDAFILVTLFVPFLDTLSLYDDLLQGRRLFARATALTVLSQLVMCGVLIGTLFTSPPLFFVVLAYFLGWTALRSGFLFYITKKYPPNDVVDEAVSSYGKHLSFIKGAGTIAGSIGSIFLFQTISGSALAVFTFAVAPVEQIRGWLAPIESLIFPKLSVDSSSLTTVRGFFAKTGLFFLIFALCVLVYIVLAPYIYALLFHKYAASVPYSQVYAPSLLISAYTLILSIILRAQGQIRKLYVSSTISIVATLSLTPLLTWAWGIWGLVAANYAIKAIETTTMSYLVFRRQALNANKDRSSAEAPGSNEKK